MHWRDANEGHVACPCLMKFKMKLYFLWQQISWAFMLHHRLKCKWTLRLCRFLHLPLLLPNSISQRCVLLLSQINCMFRSQKIGFELFCPLSVTFGILKGTWWHGRSKRIRAIFGEKPRLLFSIIFCQLEHLYKRLLKPFLRDLQRETKTSKFV